MLRTGLLYRATDVAMPLLDLAHAAEERGFDLIVAAEHTHIPVSRETPYPAGGELPDPYTRLLDPYVALSFVAAQTSLEIGTCVALVAQHDPIALAKTIATLDFMSEGRFSLGVGFGWNREELANHGRDFKQRRAVVREHIELMRTLWTETEAEYHGRYVDLERSWSWPKPVQPSLPVLLGCAPTERGFEEVVNWADGWIPGGGSAELLASWLGTLRAKWNDAGRDQAGPTVWAMQNVVDDDRMRAQLNAFQDLAISHVLFDIPTEGPDELLPMLDRYAKLLGASVG